MDLIKVVYLDTLNYSDKHNIRSKEIQENNFIKFNKQFYISLYDVGNKFKIIKILEDSF